MRVMKWSMIALDQGAFGHFRQQAAVVVLQHWQLRHHVTVLEHGVGTSKT